MIFADLYPLMYDDMPVLVRDRKHKPRDKLFLSKDEMPASLMFATVEAVLPGDCKLGYEIHVKGGDCLATDA